MAGVEKTLTAANLNIRFIYPNDVAALTEDVVMIDEDRFAIPKVYTTKSLNLYIIVGFVAEKILAE